MTEEHIIKYIKDGIYSPCRSDEADRIIVNALEKQIPREPSQLLKHKDTFDWECPRCYMTYGWCNVKLNYCYECGQALKWE